MRDSKNLKEFCKIVELLEDNYNKKLSNNILEIWFDELNMYDSKLLKKAIVEIIKENSYFPTINQVIKEIVRIQEVENSKKEKPKRKVYNYDLLTADEYELLLRNQLKADRLEEIAYYV